MQQLKIISLGGFGKVTSNMFVYELEKDILLVDCGMGFPTEEMPGVDILIPDISYLKNKQDRIRGLILTHGHEDHTGALPYILPRLDVPVFGSRLTAHLVMDKLAQYEGIPKQVNVFQPGEVLQLGQFKVESVRISHSIPDATNLVIQTPVGTVYHGSDYKFDYTPVDGVLPEVGRIANFGNAGVTLLLSDCLGSERRGHTPSEKTLEEMFEREIAHCQGKFVVTTMSSNISRLRQAIEAAVRHGRRVAVLGRSVERNLSVAQKLGYVQIPKTVFVAPEAIRKLPPQNVCILAAGSQGQSGSALERLATGEHRDARIRPGDKVVFSSDYIPGTEGATQSLIDTLSRLGATVVYSNITDDLHVSGHGSQQDLLLMMALVRAKYLIPIGGTYRHMVQYGRLAHSMGYSSDNVLLPDSDRSILVSAGQVQIGPAVGIRSVMVDGLGVGDVGQVVLRDRRVLAEEGMVVAVVEADQNNLSVVHNVELVSRGFVFAKENVGLLQQAVAEVKRIVAKRGKQIQSERFVREVVADTLERFFYDRTHRRPMILPIVVEV